MCNTKKGMVWLLAVICSLCFAVAGLCVTAYAEVAVGGERQLVEVTAPSEYFEEWGNDASTYGVTKEGIWRRDASTGEVNRQLPLKDPLTIGENKDAYLEFALPVYDDAGNLLADKTTEEIILSITNERNENLQIKFLPADQEHASGINYCVSYTPAGEWTSYWCTQRIPGDFTADNFISVKFADRAGENIMTRNADGEWIADAGINVENVAAFFRGATALKINFTYWAANCTADTNLEGIFHDIDGTVLTSEIEEEYFRIRLDAPFKEATFDGYTYTVPEATGWYGDHEVAANVTVTDQEGQEVALDENNAFIAATGEYTLTYAAEYGEHTAQAVYTVQVFSGDKQIEIPADADAFFRDWISGPSIWDENGLTSIDNSGYNVEHQRQSCYQADYNIAGDNSVTLTVSIPIYDSDGNRLPNRLNHDESGIDYLDLIIIDIDSEREFRIRMQDNYSVNEQTTFYGAYFTGDPYASPENYGGWINRYVDTPIKGTFTAESSFSFRITNKENAHFAVIAPDGAWKTVGDAADATEETSFNRALNTFLEGVENIRINFYYWATPKVATENDNLAVTYKRINGQSLVPVEGKIVDELAPVVGAAVAPNTASFSTGNSYVFDVTYVSEIFEDAAARKLVYRRSGQNEWTETGTYDSNSGRITNCRFDAVGTVEVAVKAQDLSGNIGYGEPITIQVIKGYDITVNGEVPSNGTVGEKITFPSATASDSNGVEREVVISVEDASGRSVEMDSENSFVPQTVGVYYIVYTSSYTEDGKVVSTREEFTITVRAASDVNPSEDTSSPGGLGGGAIAGIVIACVIVVAAVAVGIILVQKKKKK